MTFKFASMAILIATATEADADRRAFTFTYEYPTQVGGALELELWNTQSRAGLGEMGGASALQQQLEIEYGITDWTSISLYQTVEQESGEGLHYAETKVELRHRLAERGELPVDITLYAEVAKAFGAANFEIEPKLILARDFGAVTIAVNLIPEIVLVREEDAMGSAKMTATFVPAWAGGATYEVVPQLKVGPRRGANATKRRK